MNSAAHLVEVFSSFQGEGLRVGERHLFLRFSGCNLACDYCDTPGSRGPAPAGWRCETMPGSGVWETRPNPVEVDDLLALIDALDDPRGIHDAVSLTGGEPLLGADFINLLGPRLRDRGLDLYLETNGTLAEALSGIDPALPLTIAMDLKLAGATGQPTPWEDHRAFLDVARRRDPMATSLFAKAVVTPQVEVAEIAQAATVLAEAGDILLVIQPATPRPGGRFPTPTQLLDWHRAARGHLSTVRVIPQTHRILGQL